VNDVEIEARLTHMYQVVAAQVTAVPSLPDASPDVVVPRPGGSGRPWRALTLVAASVALVVGAVAVIRLATGGDDGPGDSTPNVQAAQPPVEAAGIRIEALPPSPLSARYAHTAVWTGQEMIVVGGMNDDDHDDNSDETDATTREQGAAAYDPAAHTWRTLADPPELIAGSATAVWTGDEMVVLATDWDDTVNTSAGPNDPAGAIYDPGEDSWRAIAPFPESRGELSPDVSAHWLDGRMIVVGVLPPGAGMPPGQGTAAYDPATDEWEALDDAPLPLRTASVTSTGDELVAVGPDAPLDGEGSLVPGTGMAAAALDPTTGTWRMLPDPPLVVRKSPVVAWTGTEVLVVGGNPSESEVLADGVAFDPATEAWSAVPPAPVPTLSAGRQSMNGFAVGGQVVVPLTIAGHAVGPPLVYDSATRTWSEGPAWPTSRRGGDATVSTGTQLLTWGGLDGENLGATANGYALTPPTAE
jgi:hypothetical protein